MTIPQLSKLIDANRGAVLSEDNDNDVSLLCDQGYLLWDDDRQTHTVTDRGNRAIHAAVKAATDTPK